MRTPVLSLAVLLGVASAGRAQETCMELLKFPEVGRWAEYQALYNNKDPYTIRYAVIGGEKHWLSSDVPFAMVKSAGKNFEMALTSHGDGAKSSITEVPQSMGGKR